jgi:hypothetical protein
VSTALCQYAVTIFQAIMEVSELPVEHRARRKNFPTQTVIGRKLEEATSGFSLHVAVDVNVKTTVDD